MGREQSLKLNIVVVSGSGTGTVTSVWDTARWIRIKPIQETDYFTAQAYDGEGILMFSRTNYQGTLSEKVEMSLGILKTIQISNATQDGTYVVKFDMP